MKKDAQRQYEAKQQVFKRKNEIVAARKATHKSDNRLALIVGGTSLLLALGAQLVYFNFGPGYVAPSPTASPTETETEQPGPPSVYLAENRQWSGALNLNDSSVEFTLDGIEAPQATANFISLVRDGFYENLSCHRLTTSGIFVLQCGDPAGDGSGGPEYRFGPIENAPDDDVYPAGTIAMARQSNLGDSMGSQFFIVYEDSTIPSDVAGGYTVFGEVTSGLDAVLAIADAGTKEGTEEPVEEVILSGLSVE